MEAAAFEAWLREFARLIAENRSLLTDLDSAIGDADHGTNLDRGMTAVVAVLDAESFATPADVLKKAGMTLVSKVGGASGPLYGTMLIRMAGAAGDGPVTDFGKVLRAGLEGVVSRGKAVLGDKTMVDALDPAVAVLQSGGDLRAAATAAAAGRDATIPLVARKGRASYLGERSAGHQDPGATSVTLLLSAAVTTLV